MSSRPPVVPALVYRPDIDGLRCLAVMLVLVFHFRLLPGLGEAGFLGVDVFFVISGYLITTLLRGQLAQQRLHLPTFYLHRVRRLAPALLATLALTLAWAWWALLPGEMAELVRQTSAAQGYLANVYYWRTLDYFGLSAERAPLLHTWSLAVEEQFYLLMPVLLAWGHRRWPDRLKWGVAAALLASFALNWVLVAAKPQATFYLLPTRAWELLAGALLTWAPPVRAQASAWRAHLLGALGMGLLGAAIALHTPDTPVPGAFALLPVLAAVALLRAGEHPGGWTAWALARQPLVYLGRISYPAYLVHWPLHVLAGQHLGAQYDLGWRWGMFGASLLLAALVLHGLETPIRQGRWLRRDRHLLWAYVGSLLMAVALLVGSHYTGGYAQRFSPEVVRLAAYSNDQVPLLPACERVPGAQPEPSCRLGAPEAAPQWLVLGDSHAWALRDALDAWLRQRGEAGILAFQHGCPPLLGVSLVGDGGGHCRQFNQGMADWLVGQPQVRAVLMVSTWRQVPEGRLLPAPGHTPGLNASLQAFEQGLDATLSHWQRLGKAVVVWEPVPGARRPVPPALARALRDGLPEAPNLLWSAQAYRAEFAFLTQALDRHAASLAGRIRTGELLCASGNCEVQRNGLPLYFDAAHASRSSAPLWADLMRQAGVPALAQLHPVPAH